MNHQTYAKLIDKARGAMVDASNEMIDEMGDMVGRNIALNVVVQAHALSAAVILSAAIVHTHNVKEGENVYREIEKRFLDVIQEAAGKYGKTIRVDLSGA